MAIQPMQVSVSEAKNRLPELHVADPFDRQLIAQALSENIPVVTSDRVFSRYSGIKVIW